MKLSKTNIFLISFLGAGVIVYSGLLFLLPVVLNSSFMVQKYEQAIAKKTGFPVKIDGFKFVTHPNLSFGVKVGKIISKTDKSSDIVNISDISYSTKLLSVKPEKVDIKDIYIDFSKIQSFVESKNKTSSKDKFDLGYFPLLNINHIYIR